MEMMTNADEENGAQSQARLDGAASERAELTTDEHDDDGRGVQRVGEAILRYGLVGVLASVGAMKFTDYETKAITPLIRNSPIFSGLTHAFGPRSVSRAIGIAEIAIAGLIALRPKSPRLSAIGSGLAVGMFGTTLSFLASTPGAFTQSKRGVPIMSAAVGQFLAKDLVLLGAAVWSLGEALTARRGRGSRAAL